MPLYSIGDLKPTIHPTAFVAPNAVLIGDVVLDEGASVWFNCLLRGDSGRIHIGAGTNVQDGVVMHERVEIGKNCVIAHMAFVHRAVVGNDVLVGDGALVFDDTEVGDGCVVAAGAVISPGTKVPPNTLMLGVPAKPREGLVPEGLHKMTAGLAAGYAKNGQRYKTSEFKLISS